MKNKKESKFRERATGIYVPVERGEKRPGPQKIWSILKKIAGVK
jgi:hypothetical protein